MSNLRRLPPASAPPAPPELERDITLATIAIGVLLGLSCVAVVILLNFRRIASKVSTRATIGDLSSLTTRESWLASHCMPPTHPTNEQDSMRSNNAQASDSNLHLIAEDSEEAEETEVLVPPVQHPTMKLLEEEALEKARTQAKHVPSSPQRQGSIEARLQESVKSEEGHGVQHVPSTPQRQASIEARLQESARSEEEHGAQYLPIVPPQRQSTATPTRAPMVPLPPEMQNGSGGDHGGDGAGDGGGEPADGGMFSYNV